MNETGTPTITLTAEDLETIMVNSIEVMAAAATMTEADFGAWLTENVSRIARQFITEAVLPVAAR